MEQGDPYPGDRNCLDVACALAWRRLEEGGEPELLAFRPPSPDPQLTLFHASDYEPLDHAIGRFPKVALLTTEGRFSWNCHVVCAENGWVFDPMLDEPVTLEEYRIQVLEDESTVCEVLRDTAQLRQERKRFGRPWDVFTKEEYWRMNEHRTEHIRILIRRTRRQLGRPEFLTPEGKDDQGWLEVYVGRP